MVRIVSLAACCIICAGAVYAAAPAPIDQAKLEHDFDAGVRTDEMAGWMKQMASEPNHVGTAHDKANA